MNFLQSNTQTINFKDLVPEREFQLTSFDFKGNQILIGDAEGHIALYNQNQRDLTQIQKFKSPITDIKWLENSGDYVVNTELEGLFLVQEKKAKKLTDTSRTHFYFTSIALNHNSNGFLAKSSFQEIAKFSKQDLKDLDYHDFQVQKKTTNSEALHLKLIKMNEFLIICKRHLYITSLEKPELILRQIGYPSVSSREILCGDILANGNILVLLEKNSNHAISTYELDEERLALNPLYRFEVEIMNSFWSKPNMLIKRNQGVSKVFLSENENLIIFDLFKTGKIENLEKRERIVQHYITGIGEGLYGDVWIGDVSSNFIKVLI